MKPYATTFKSGTARAHSAPIFAIAILSQKRKKGNCVYLRFLRKTAATAAITITTTAAITTRTSVLTPESGLGADVGDADAVGEGVAVGLGDGEP